MYSIILFRYNYKTNNEQHFLDVENTTNSDNVWKRLFEFLFNNTCHFQLIL